MDRKYPLAGIRVIEFGHFVVGPCTGRYLADHGAEVIKIESQTAPDGFRRSSPYPDNIAGLNRSGFFNTWNTSKFSVTLNMNHPKGPELCRRLIRVSDAVISNLSPRPFRKWGLDYESLKKIKPDIIYLSMSLMGETGPHQEYVGWGPVLEAVAGINHLTGFPEGVPSGPNSAITDWLVPYFGACVLVSALDYRRRTGQGVHSDLSQFEVAIHILETAFLDYKVNGREASRLGNHVMYPPAAPHGVYPCRGDDRWCTIAVYSEEEWDSFCQVLGNPPWARDAKFSTLWGRLESQEELDRRVEEWTKERTAEEVMTRMQEAGVSAGMVEKASDLHEDPQLKYRGHFQILDHPEMGEAAYDRFAFRLSKTPAEIRRRAPLLGEHNSYVYSELLGLSDEEFVALLGEGVFE